MPASYADMPQNTVVQLLVVGRYLQLCTQTDDRAAYFPENTVFEHALLTGDYPVTACGVEAAYDIAVLVSAHRILRLVAVSSGSGIGNDRQKFRLQSAYPGESRANDLRLCPELGFVGNMPERTAAASAENFAVRRDAVGGGGYDIFDLSVAVAFTGFHDAHIKNIADRGKRHENHHSLVSADTCALVGYAVYRKLYVVVFSHCFQAPCSSGTR